MKQTKITKSARGEQCLVRIPGICCHDPSTVVLAHLNGSGLALKANDIHAAYACHTCHAVLDGHANSVYSNNELKLMHLEGMVRTQLKLIEKGLLEVKA